MDDQPLQRAGRYRPRRIDIGRAYEDMRARRERLSTRLRPRSSASAKARFYVAMQAQDGFGSGSPHWTIPSSRRDPRPPDATPDPGAYSPPHSAIETHRGVAIRSRIERCDRVTPTELNYDPKAPPPGPAITIGNIHPNEHFYMPLSAAPGPSYAPTTDNAPKAAIRSKYPGRDAETISPGPKYTPHDPGATSNPAFSVPRASPHSYFDPMTDGNPGPGTYNVGKQVGKPPRWTARAKEKANSFRKRLEEMDRPWAPRRSQNG
jgi:hypothetical protein